MDNVIMREFLEQVNDVQVDMIYGVSFGTNDEISITMPALLERSGYFAHGQLVITDLNTTITIDIHSEVKKQEDEDGVVYLFENAGQTHTFAI